MIPSAKARAPPWWTKPVLHQCPPEVFSQREDNEHTQLRIAFLQPRGRRRQNVRSQDLLGSRPVHQRGGANAERLGAWSLAPPACARLWLHLPSRFRIDFSGTCILIHRFSVLFQLHVCLEPARGVLCCYVPPATTIQKYSTGHQRFGCLSSDEVPQRAALLCGED